MLFADWARLRNLLFEFINPLGVRSPFEIVFFFRRRDKLFFQRTGFPRVPGMIASVSFSVGLVKSNELKT